MYIFVYICTYVSISLPLSLSRVQGSGCRVPEIVRNKRLERVLFMLPDSCIQVLSLSLPLSLSLYSIYLSIYPWTRLVGGAQHSTLDTQHSTLNTQHSTLNTQYATLNTQHSTLITQHSTLNTQHSTLNTQHSTPNRQRPHTLPGGPARQAVRGDVRY